MTISRIRICLALALVACGSDLDPPGPKAATVTSAQLSALRWIEGTWRAESTFGEAPLFFERYAFVDDSTLRVISFPDSTLQVAPETTYFELRRGHFATRGGGPRFAAEIFTPTSVTFMPMYGANNHFTWEYRSPDQWGAKLNAPAEGDQPARVLEYHMSRVK